ncbi:hypothetical protein [Streptomyces spiralis]|uniref:LexA family protein n=1 Tax=Streptomyces spiralis TaxID=66376 RepID=UPI0033C9C314
MVAPLLDRSGPHAGGPGPSCATRPAPYCRAAVNRRPDHLTEREEQILRCIRRWIEDTGEGPSVRQLAHAVGMRSPASVVYHLAHLERSGALVRDGRGWSTCRLGH